MAAATRQTEWDALTKEDQRSYLADARAEFIEGLTPGMDSDERKEAIADGKDEILEAAMTLHWETTEAGKVEIRERNAQAQTARKARMEAFANEEVSCFGCGKTAPRHTMVTLIDVGIKDFCQDCQR